MNLIAVLAARREARRRKLDLLDDLREFQRELERAEIAHDDAVARLSDAQADLLDDLREFQRELERAEIAHDDAVAWLSDAQADVANALRAAQDAGVVDIAGEPAEGFE
jgi:chromosome segregation ATPase